MNVYSCPQTPPGGGGVDPAGRLPSPDPLFSRYTPQPLHSIDKGLALTTGQHYRAACDHLQGLKLVGKLAGSVTLVIHVLCAEDTDSLPSCISLWYNRSELLCSLAHCVVRKHICLKPPDRCNAVCSRQVCVCPMKCEDKGLNEADGMELVYLRKHF